MTLALPTSLDHANHASTALSLSVRPSISSLMLCTLIKVCRLVVCLAWVRWVSMQLLGLRAARKSSVTISAISAISAISVHLCMLLQVACAHRVQARWTVCVIRLGVVCGARGIARVGLVAGGHAVSHIGKASIARETSAGAS